MANTKISALTALTGANLATNDQLAVVDTSAVATKSITVAELKLGIMPAPGPIGGTTPSTGAFTTLSAAGTTNDGTALVPIVQSGTGRAVQVTRAVSGATRSLLNILQGHATGGSEAALDVQQATVASPAIRVTSDGSTAVFSVLGTGAVTSGSLAVTGTISATTGAAVGGATAGTGGLAFPATAVAVADANTLDDYEEGTWTPTITSGTGTITTVGAVAGTYTKLGRKVTLSAQFAITTNGTGASVLKVNGLPFTGSQATVTYYCPNATNRSDAFVLSAEYNPGASNTINLYKYDGTYPGADGKTYTLSVTFNV